MTQDATIHKKGRYVSAAPIPSRGEVITIDGRTIKVTDVTLHPGCPDKWPTVTIEGEVIACGPR
jgi:hypothetical protein